MKEIRPFPELEPGTKRRGESQKQALFAYTQSRNPISSGTVSSTLASMSAWYERMSNERDIRSRQHSQLPKCTKPSRDLRPNDNGTSSPFNQSALYLIVDRIECTPGLNSLSVTRRRKEDQIRSLRIEEKVDLSSTRFHFQKLRLPAVLYSGCATIRSSLSRV